MVQGRGLRAAPAPGRGGGHSKSKGLADFGRPLVSIGSPSWMPIEPCAWRQNRSFGASWRMFERSVWQRKRKALQQYVRLAPESGPTLVSRS